VSRTEVSRVSEDADPTSVALECVICASKPRAFMFQPCGHFLACQQCAARVKDCPACRAPIASLQQVYM
jgi:hypothetical protein